MADHLFLSLEPAPSLIFACLPRPPCRLSRPTSFSAGIRFSARDRRLSNSTFTSHSSPSASPSPDSTLAKFDLVSSFQLKDGSYIFRFGDASEIERNLEAKETISRVAEKAGAGELSAKQAMEDSHTEEACFHISKLEGPSYSVTKAIDSNVKSVLQKEDVSAMTDRNNIIKIKDRKKTRSPSKKKKALNPVYIPQDDDTVETQHAGASDVSSQFSSIVAVPNISVEEKGTVSRESKKTNGVDIVSELSPLELSSECHVHPKVVTEKDAVSDVADKSSLSDDSETHDHPQLTKKDIESQTTTKSYTPQISSESFDPQEVAEEKTGIKVTHISTIGQVDNLDAVEKKTFTDFEAKENHVVELKATEVVPPPEEATHHSVEDIKENSMADISDVAMRSEDAKSEASITKTETTVSDTKADHVEVSASDLTEAESYETASGREGIASKGFYLDSGVSSLRSPSKALAGREDANFIAHGSWLGVADGVSQWSFERISPGVYAQELLSNCQKILSDETFQRKSPVEVLSISSSQTKSHGSSTVLVAHFDNHELRIANIGDSGFMIIRDGTVLLKSSPMVLEFGFPLQIMQGDDPLKFAEIYQANLDEGDVVITATDGLFDNLHEKEITSIVSTSLQQSLEPQKIAELLSEKAQEVGGSASARTPYADTAQAAGYTECLGGKLDSVTVIVSLVRSW